MSRELKFRALVEQPGTDIRYFHYFNINTMIPSKLSVVAYNQFTGLHDKNGKEIYEGDILQITSNIVTLSDSKETGEVAIVLELVKWIDDGWGYKKIRNVQNYPGIIPHESKGLRISASYGEVIGNIYENHDLLQDGSSAQ